MISVVDVAYVRYQAPDLDRMERFLMDFGMRTAHRTSSALYMRGWGTQPFVHVTELGPDAHALGFGLLARSAQDLPLIAAELSTTVNDNPEPGGGRVVSVLDPQKLRVDVVYGGTTLKPLAARESLGFNVAGSRTRFGRGQRVRMGPSHVMRLGHVVLNVPNLAASLEFYSGHFGFRVTDSYYVEQPQRVVATFLHCGLGKQFIDHHSLALIAEPRGGFEHAAFEVLDWDDLVVGNLHLRGKPYKHSWGIGRHVEGSQIFDYWRDPFGNKIEHWTDGDLVNEDYVSGSKPLTIGGLAQWGPPMGDDFMS